MNSLKELGQPLLSSSWHCSSITHMDMTAISVLLKLFWQHCLIRFQFFLERVISVSASVMLFSPKPSLDYFDFETKLSPIAFIHWLLSIWSGLIGLLEAKLYSCWSVDFWLRGITCYYYCSILTGKGNMQKSRSHSVLGMVKEVLFRHFLFHCFWQFSKCVPVFELLFQPIFQLVYRVQSHFNIVSIQRQRKRLSPLCQWWSCKQTSTACISCLFFFRYSPLIVNNVSLPCCSGPAVKSIKGAVCKIWPHAPNK